ncbi:MAG: efflux transporter outer membrane subunit [Stenotrophobium sp.]
MNSTPLIYYTPLSFSRFIAALILSTLAGCAVGPDFRQPAAPVASTYTDHPLSIIDISQNVNGGQVQHFDKGADIPGDWWTLFHSKPLNGLIEQALANNHDLKAAQAALSASRENFLAGHGAYYPSVSASFSASREQDPSGALSSTTSTNTYRYNLFTPQVSVSYVPDVFGLNRRTVESLQAQEQGVRFQMLATYTALTANVVVTAIQEAALQAQIDATHQLIAIDSNALEIIKYQFSKGYAGGLDVAAQQAQLAQVNASLPPLIKQLAQLHDLMAVLTGRFPNQGPAEKFELSSLQLPQELPVSLPSKLVEQRPDVAQAEANLHAASAQIGIATANRLPNIVLTADAGSTALTLSQLFMPGSGFWTLGATLTAPIFQGGALLHQERAAKAAYIEAAEQYRSTVLTAFQNVADTLNALEQDAAELKAAAAAADAAKVTLDLSQKQTQAGYANELSLLNAEQSYQQAQMSLVQAQASRYADTAALFQALGGGWWHHKELERNNDEK